MSPDINRLREAARDLRYLLSRGYPQVGALTFVGNRYQLVKEDREVLARGVHPEDQAQSRRGRLLTPEAVAGRSLAVDGHNVLITLESALTGRVLVDCDDGVIRDVAGVHGAYRTGPETDQAIEMILDFITRRRAASLLFILESRLSESGELAAEVGARMAGRSMMGRARTSPAVDRELMEFTGVACTSDSAILDRAASPLDLAGAIIRALNPPPERIDLAPPAG
jgi:hypothetical protein